MKRSLLFPCLLLIVYAVQGQILSGRVIYDQLYSQALENTGGEDPTRSVSIYLPPGYENTKDKYPVIYYLHGITQRDRRLITKRGIDKLLDKAIATGKIKPVILVISDQFTLYRGSFYTNSSLTGNWSDFTAKDLITYMETFGSIAPQTSLHQLGDVNSGAVGYYCSKVGTAQGLDFIQSKIG